MPLLYVGSVDWADFDKDGRPDALAAGSHFDLGPEDSTTSITKVYRNMGGTFQEVPNTNLTPVSTRYGSENNRVTAKWGDYDGDSYPDILLSGTLWEKDPVTSRQKEITKIYHNNQDGTFSEIPTALPQVAYSAGSWGDYDGDGREDILLAGPVSAPVGLLRIFRNEGNGIFTQTYSRPSQRFATFGDYDGDGDLDLNTDKEILRNDGNNVFTVVKTFPLTVVPWAEWGDSNGDGRPDLARMGYYPSSFFEVNRNDGSDIFTQVFRESPGYYRGDLNWGDYDADGQLDLGVTGFSATTGSEKTMIYRNDNGAFVPSVPLQGLAFSQLSWIDYDGDGILDIYLNGCYSTDTVQCMLYGTFLRQRVLFTLGGQILTLANNPLAGITVKDLVSGTTRITDTDGRYNFGDLPQGTKYRVVPLSPPSPPLYRFLPSDISGLLTENKQANFTAYYNVTVTVDVKMLDGTPVQGVLIKHWSGDCSEPITGVQQYLRCNPLYIAPPTTDSTGKFKAVLRADNRSYTFTATKSPLLFSPKSAVISALKQDETLTFTAVLPTDPVVNFCQGFGNQTTVGGE